MGLNRTWNSWDVGEHLTPNTIEFDLVTIIDLTRTESHYTVPGSLTTGRNGEPYLAEKPSHRSMPINTSQPP